MEYLITVVILDYYAQFRCIEYWNLTGVVGILYSPENGENADLAYLITRHIQNNKKVLRNSAVDILASYLTILFSYQLQS